MELRTEPGWAHTVCYNHSTICGGYEHMRHGYPPRVATPEYPLFILSTLLAAAKSSLVQLSLALRPSVLHMPLLLHGCHSSRTVPRMVGTWRNWAWCPHLCFSPSQSWTQGLWVSVSGHRLGHSISWLCSVSVTWESGFCPHRLTLAT